MDFSVKKLLWSEGTMLAQQHFQQWDNLQQSRDKFWHHFYKQRPRTGFLNLEIDAEILEFGFFRINNFQAVSWDGEILGFQSDENIGKLLELDLNSVEWSDEPKHGSEIVVYIAIPKGSDSYGISGYPKKDIKKTRWLAEYKKYTDEMDADRKNEILLGNLNVQLLIKGSVDFHKRESENDLLIVAKIVFLGEGRYALKPNFVPSILVVGASKKWIRDLEKFSLYLKSIENALTGAIKRVNKDNLLCEWRTRETLKIVSLLSYQVRSWIFNPKIDPEELIGAIIQSIISLRAFSKEIQDLELVMVTESTDLYQSWCTLICLLKKIVQNILPIRQKNINLVKRHDPWLLSEPLEPAVLEMADLYLTVSFHQGISWIERFVKEVKLCGLKDIQRIITQALPGLMISHCTEEFLIDKSKYYFKIHKLGQYWENVKNTGNICVFVSKSFLESDIKLVALFEHDKYD